MAPRALGPVLLTLAAIATVACVRSPSSPSVATLRDPDGQASAAPYGDLTHELRAEAALASFIDDAERRRIEVLVAIPDEASHSVERRSFRADAEYFYPASAVKLCAAVAALVKLDELRAQRHDLMLTTPLRITFADDHARVVETTLQDEIERALVVSDNEAFNRLFDFVGAEELSSRLRELGLDSARIVHRLGDSGDSGAPAFELLGSGRPLPVAQRVGVDRRAARSALVGSAYVDDDGRLVEAPLDFGEKNRIGLRDLQDLLIAVVRPDLASIPPPRWSNDDRERLASILGHLPSELPGRPPRALDDRHKPLLAPVSEALPGHAIRVFGKGGRAYGFTVENSYVVDETTGRSVFVAATVYTNDNGTINDDKYEYTTVADPFLGHLGRAVARAFLEVAAAHPTATSSPPERASASRILAAATSSFVSTRTR